MSLNKILVLISAAMLSVLLSSCPAIVNPENMDPEIASTLLNLSGDSSIKSFAVRGSENNQFVFTHYGDVETYYKDNQYSDQPQSGKIHMMLPPGSNPDNITPYVELAENSSYSPKGAVNFNDLNSINVTAEDGTERFYDFTYEIEAPYGDQITGFMLKKSANPGVLLYDVTAVYDPAGSTITLTVPNNAVPPFPFIAPDNFIPSFEIQGDRVYGVDSGVTSVDFSSSFPFTVAATPADKTYTVSVNVARNTQNEMISFKLYQTDNPALTADYTGTITGSDVNLTLPVGTDVTSLTPAVLISPESSITDPLSLTGIDFSAAVLFTVTAEDGSTQDYNVYVTL